MVPLSWARQAGLPAPSRAEAARPTARFPGPARLPRPAGSSWRSADDDAGCVPGATPSARQGVSSVAVRPAAAARAARSLRRSSSGHLRILVLVVLDALLLGCEPRP
ncbi:hypothetical protein [Ornithinimicrobium kibberense]|uniref:hypothetical protein n=1 Tax=Ornithinimicrobium kibberense TaxID=282060 RepID=UPI00360C23F9